MVQRNVKQSLHDFRSSLVYSFFQLVSAKLDLSLHQLQFVTAPAPSTGLTCECILVGHPALCSSILGMLHFGAPSNVNDNCVIFPIPVLDTISSYNHKFTCSSRYATNLSAMLFSSQLTVPFSIVPSVMAFLCTVTN